jgi:molybdenum cofactor biosynthesis enzyme MoaA
MASDEPNLPPALSTDKCEAASDTPGPTAASTIWRRQAELGKLREEIIGRRLACRYPWEQLEAHDIRGVVTPCAGGWPLEKTLEHCVSWHTTSLMEAWNSPAMQNVRRAVSGGDPMATCKPECPAFHGGPQNAVPGLAAPTTKVMFDNMMANIHEMLDGAPVLKSRPQSISFSPTLRCTNRCRMCDIHEVMEVMGRPAQVREMPDALFNELLELLPTTRMLALTGGEPLISRRMRLLLMEFRADRYPDGAVTITTNGQLLRESLLKDLSNTRIKLFYVSLNAADDAMYEHVSGIPGGFTRVRNHLQMLMDMAPHMAGRPGVVTSFVVMRSNFRQLPAFLDLALGLKVGIRLLPIERDRLGESIFTDEPTLREVHRMMVEKVIPDMNYKQMPWGYKAEIMKLFSVIDSRLARREFKPL